MVKEVVLLSLSSITPLLCGGVVLAMHVTRPVFSTSANKTLRWLEVVMDSVLVSEVTRISGWVSVNVTPLGCQVTTPWWWKCLSFACKDSISKLIYGADLRIRDDDCVK